MGNPEADDANVGITFMFEDGTTQRQSLLVPAGSRATVDVNSVVGLGKSVSARVELDRAIAC